MKSKYKLKSNVVVEPLIARYAASPYLMSPASSPRFFRHLVNNILSSFVKNPRAHEKVLENPAFKGGPFVTVSSTMAPEAQRLLDNLRDRLAPQLAAADGMDELSKILAEAEGQAMDDYLEKIPVPLKGLTELFYERSGKASYRVAEGLAYHSELYDEGLQEVLLYELTTDERDFVLTTPRFDQPSKLFLQIPLRSEALDELAAARHSSIDDLDLLASTLQVKPEQMELFRSFFVPITDEITSSTPQLPKETGLRARYFGHACVEVATDKSHVLFDPFVSYDIGKLDGRLTLSDLPEKLDALVITHLHLDHFNIETLLQLRYKTGCVIIPKSNGGSSLDPSGKQILMNLGFSQVIEINEMERVKIGDIEITALPFHGEHGDLDITGKATFLARSSGRSILFGADVRLASQEILDRLGRIIGKVDCIYLGMESEGAPLSWVYGPLLDTPIPRKWDKVRRLNGSNAAAGKKFINAFDTKKARIYALGREPWLAHIMHIIDDENSPVQIQVREFLESCKDDNIDAQMLFVKSSETI